MGCMTCADKLGHYHTGLSPHCLSPFVCSPLTSQAPAQKTSALHRCTVHRVAKYDLLILARLSLKRCMHCCRLGQGLQALPLDPSSETPYHQQGGTRMSAVGPGGAPGRVAVLAPPGVGQGAWRKPQVHTQALRHRKPAANKHSKAKM